jgi:hypothetical protein
MAAHIEIRTLKYIVKLSTTIIPAPSFCQVCLNSHSPKKELLVRDF